MLIGVVATNACVSFWNISTLAATNRLTVHTHEVLTQIGETLSLLKDAETGQRGYLITGEATYLQPYENAAGGIHERSNRLRELTADNANQQTRVDRLERLIVERFDELNLTVALRKEKGFETARKVVLEDTGKSGMDEIRQLMAEMGAEEQQLLQVRTVAADWRVRLTLMMLVLVTCSALVVAYVQRFVAEREHNPPKTPLSTNRQQGPPPACSWREAAKTMNGQRV
ncbi:MAG TPA: CHASE3 domain-containing protein [Gemmataceae bacterium]|nr:CHASE3 domain-containing protein [Gemmataceae bacterium]